MFSPTETPAQPGKKRKRTAQACGPCRTKKTKCDGIHPQCTPCISLGYTCSYNLDSSAPVAVAAGQVLVSQDYLQTLEQRILNLERGPQSTGPPSTAPPSAVTKQESVEPPSVSPALEIGPVFVPSEPTPGGPPSSDRPDHGPEIDGMGMLLAPQTQPPDSQSQEQEVYGAMSGISFHHMLLDRLLPGYWCLTGPRSASADVGFLGLAPLPEIFFPTKADLPSRSAARRMIDYFESHTWQMYPFVDLNQIRTQYEALLDSVAADPVGPLHLASNQPMICLHFSVFAVVESITETSFTNINVGRVVLRMLRKHIDWAHSTLKVQALLMGAMVMQGMDHPGYSWDLLGYAIRSAYAVGLHDETINKKFPPAEREMRRRVWWGCYAFDRLITVSIGRPSAITVEPEMPLPEALPGEPEAPTQFFCDAIRLYQALSDVISNPPKSFQNASSDFVHAIESQTHQLEKAYANWCDTARLNDASNRNTELATVLTLRGLTMRMLLHRRVMLAGIHEYIPGGSHRRPRTSLEHLEARQRDLVFGISLGLIIETAVHTIRILETPTDEDVLSAPWYQLFYAMNAFMCLVATFMLDLSEWAWFIRLPGVPIVQALHSVKDVVRRIGDKYHRPSARQALLIIEHVLQTLNIAGPLQPADEFNIPGLQDLPHLDIDELCQSLGLEFGGQTSLPADPAAVPRG